MARPYFNQWGISSSDMVCFVVLRYGLILLSAGILPSSYAFIFASELV